MACFFDFNIGGKLTTNKRVFDENCFINCMYTDRNLYQRLGQSFCCAFDVALAKGGTEAVVESLYSVMKTQLKCGMLTNDTLVLRTKIDWHLPDSPLGIETFLNEATQLYTEQHRYAVTSTLGSSKVMTRLTGDEGRLPPTV